MKRQSLFQALGNSHEMSKPIFEENNKKKSVSSA